MNWISFSSIMIWKNDWLFEINMTSLFLFEDNEDDDDVSILDLIKKFWQNVENAETWKIVFAL